MKPSLLLETYYKKTEPKSSYYIPIDQENILLLLQNRVLVHINIIITNTSWD